MRFCFAFSVFFFDKLVFHELICVCVFEISSMSVCVCVLDLFWVCVCVCVCVCVWHLLWVCVCLCLKSVSGSHATPLAREHSCLCKNDNVITSMFCGPPQTNKAKPRESMERPAHRDSRCCQQHKHMERPAHRDSRRCQQHKHMERPAYRDSRR